MESMVYTPQRKNNLVILSVSFLRVARVLLGSSVLDTIKKNHDVLIVGPHANDPHLQADFSEPGVNFFKLNLTASMHPVERILEAITSIQRMHGHWFRYRNTDIITYYHRNAVFSVSKDGKSKRFSLTKAILYRLIAMTGYWRWSWRITDSLIGFLFREPTNLASVIAGYDKVTLVQSALWGKQDAFLAWYARKKKWRTILMPYSTDQLFIGGFLLCDYDAVCIQGLFEKKCATLLHAIPKNKQIYLGSAWFRNIDKILNKTADLQKHSNATDIKYILFAGHSCFPKESEYRALTYLEKAVSEGLLGKAKIIYRPVAINAEDIQRVLHDFGQRSNIEIQLPQMSIIGLEHEPHKKIKIEWQDYIAQLQKIDILVMSYVSSLIIDVAYLKKPVIAILDDPSGELSKSRLDLMFDSNGKLPGLEQLPLVHDIKELVPLIKKALFAPSHFNPIRDSIISSWDFPEVNFIGRLKEVLDND